MKSRVSLLLLAAALAAVAVAPPARADGDPGSDVLVYQPLFLAANAGVSGPEQARLSGLLQAAARSGFPIRVAIIATRSDLGAVTGLWRKPRAYARFLGIELSLAYSGRLLVVMPNGLGFNWPGHSPTTAYRTLTHIQVGRGSLTATAQAAAQALATAAGVKLAGAAAGSAQPTPASQRPAPSTGSAAPGASVDTLVAIDRGGAGGGNRAGGARAPAARILATSEPACASARASPACRGRGWGGSPGAGGRDDRGAARDRIADHGRERCAYQKPEPRPGHAAHAGRARLHADRPVRPAGIARARSAARSCCSRSTTRSAPRSAR